MTVVAINDRKLELIFMSSIDLRDTKSAGYIFESDSNALTRNSWFSLMQRMTTCAARNTHFTHFLRVSSKL